MFDPESWSLALWWPFIILVSGSFQRAINLLSLCGLNSVLSKLVIKMSMN